VWAFSGIPVASFIGTDVIMDEPLSFTIPLKLELAAAAVHVVAEGEAPTTGPCAGGTVAEPVAEAGNLCIFTGHASADVLAIGTGNPATGGEGAAKTGAVLSAVSGKGEVVEASGTWAVTAP
jgi:hypothetical protein